MKPQLHKVAGHDGKFHLMTILRKCGNGVGNFANVTRFMGAKKLDYIRKRAKRTAYEARQRDLILNDPYKIIREHLLS